MPTTAAAGTTRTRNGHSAAPSRSPGMRAPEQQQQNQRVRAVLHGVGERQADGAERLMVASATAR